MVAELLMLINIINKLLLHQIVIIKELIVIQYLVKMLYIINNVILLQLIFAKGKEVQQIGILL